MQSATIRYGLAVGLVVLGACAEPGLTRAPDPTSDGGELDSGAPAPLDVGVEADIGPIVDAGDGHPDATVIADAAAPADSGSPIADAGPLGIGPTCFPEIWDPNANGPNYDQFGTVMGAHCKGTNHQAITNIERVVFLGDSVTVGTPPTPSDEYYRSVLADQLVARFGLEAPSGSWKLASLVNGTSLVRESGDFASCAKYGARTDDLIQDNTQIVDCFPEAERTKRTLVIMTIGGNDIASITKDGAPSGGKTLAEVQAMTEAFVLRLREAIHWFKDDPSRFPNGVYVVFSNMFEFTDATGDVSSCPAAGVAGFDEAWANPIDLENLVIWANEQFVQIAVETQTDVIMMLEAFCGHGYHNEDAAGRCYRGPTAERWFDLSCIHPNPTGHQVIADMFMSVVDE